MLHCIKIGFSIQNYIDLIGLAQNLLSTTSATKGLPASLRRLELVTYEDHDRPLENDAQEREDRYMEGIDMFMTRCQTCPVF